MVRWLVCACLAANLTWADSDLDALQLADETPEAQGTMKPWHVILEAAGGYQKRRPDGDSWIGRTSLDVRVDHKITPHWRAVFSDRLDSFWDTGDRADVNTLKEAWISWQPDSGTALDAGRINARFGSAMGFNPTDVFKDGALRSVVSIDPESIRNNRLGVVMARGQRWWQGGALTAVVAPELDDEPDDSDFSPDWGSSNPRSRWLIVLTQNLWHNFSPQLLIQDGVDQTPLVGLNISMLLNSRSTAYLEYSGGRRPSLEALAGLAEDDTRFRSQLASGVTWTGDSKQSVTFEYQYDETGASESSWQRIRSTDTQSFSQYLGIAGSKQQLPTRHALFSWIDWQDALWPRFNIRVMMRYDLVDDSRQYWIDFRRHLDRVDVALQYQANEGDARSNFGAYPVRQNIQIIFQVFL